PTFVPVKSFQNITEYEKLEKGSRFQPGCWRKVEFDLQGNEKAVPTNLRFKVVLNNQYVTDPIYVHVTISLGSEFESDSDYRDQEVSQVQYVVTKMFINYWQKKRKTNKFVATEAFYTSSLPERITISPRNQALSALDAFFPFLYIGLAVFAGSYVVEEKESRLKEAMKLMGLKTFSFWFSWFLTSFKTGFFICLLFMIFLKWTGYTNGNILSSSSGWILLFMIIYAIDAISFSFMLTCFINKARNFVICAVALYFSLTLGAPILSSYLCGKVSAHVGGLLFFQFAAQHFKTMFINFEWREVGLISEKLNVYEVLPYLHFIDTLIMFITNTLFNCIIIWYVSNIFPEEYGVPQPYNFFLKKSYWCPPTESEESIPALSGMDERYFQPASKNLTPGIQIRGLIKVFDKKVVVAGIDLDLFEDQITVLLGHNGAGKTTTINMLTGFLKPTKGTAIVNGIDLTKNLTKARENFGLCPQHDILFSRLTCNEHLSFYSQLRNQYHKTRTAEEAEDLLKALHIYDHRTSYSQVLSGGQKRKLSVACAFIGNTKCIFLDEPSSGLDPSARRELWDFLKTKQKGRTILLTTHYMDEADVLGDRIVIMAEGVIKCCGTPNFLKRIYGTGYQLTIEKKPDCSVKKVTSMIQSHIPEGRYMQETPTEIFYILPDEEVPLYSRLLFEMEKDKVELKISTFGLTATSLEDVFIRVGEGFEPNRFEVKPPAHRMTVDYMALHASHHRESSVDCEPLFDMTATNRASIPGVVPTEDKTASNQAGSEEVKRVDTPTEPETETNLSVKVGSDTIQVIKSKQSLRSSVETIEIFEHMTNYTKLERIQLFIQQAKAIYFKKFLLFRRSWGTSLFLILLPMFLTLLGINQRLGSQRKAKSPDLLFTVKRFPPDLRYLVFYKSDDFHQVSDHYRIMIMEKKGVVEHFDLEPDDTTENVTAILHGLMDKIGYIMFREKYLFGLIEMKHLQDPYSSKPTRVPAAIVLYQRRIPHGENIATQLALDAWVRSALGSEFSVQAGLRDYSTSASSESFGGGEFMITLLCITFSVVLVPVMMMFSLTQERAIGSKHLQDLTGVNPVAYWLATYIFDSSVYLLIVMLIVMSLQQEPVIYDNQTRGFVMYIVLMIYGQAFFPYLYALQFYFENPTKASITLMMASLLIGFTAFFSIETSLKSLSDWGVVYFMHILIILLAPCYLLLMSGFLTFWIYHRQDEQEDPPSLLQFLRYRDRGRSILNALIEMAVLAVLAWAVLFLIEFRIYRLIRYKLMPYLNPETPKDSDNFKEDDDVIQERQLIYTTDKATLFLR
ncbi:ATP-binding cassette sub-family A member 3, partial [Biomphalaria glabrata]